MEAEVHPHSIPEMVVVDVRTAVEKRILQVEVEKGEAGTKVVSSGEVGIRVSVGKGSAAVVVVVDGTSYVEVGAVETHTWLVVVEYTRSVGVAAVAESKSRRVSWDYFSAFLTRRKDRAWVSAGAVKVVEGRIVEVVEVVGCKILKVADGVELVEMELRHIGLASVQDLTNRADSGKMEVAELGAGTLL